MNDLAEHSRVLRFGRTERVYHWVQAIPFLVLLVSGGLLLLQRLTGIGLVSEPLLLLTHKYAGCALPIGLLLVVVGGDRSVLWRNLRLSLSWKRDDLRWVVRLPLRALSRRVELPPSGKFNPGQKLNILGQVVLIPVLLASGLLMWFGKGVLIAWYVHIAAFALITPPLLVHLYLAVLGPGTRRSFTSMISGQVDAEWAREHHSLEYGVVDEPAPPEEVCARE